MQSFHTHTQYGREVSSFRTDAVAWWTGEISAGTAVDFLRGNSSLASQINLQMI